MANIYVNHTGSATPPYDTEAKAATNIQVALDAASEGDTVLIKADQDYVMDGNDQQAAQFDVDVNDNITIKGYYLNPGDQDYGGAYYKDSSHGWAVIDANNGTFDVFSMGEYSAIRFHNIKIINVNSSYTAFDLTLTNYLTGHMLQNCWVTGGKYAVFCSHSYYPVIEDCKFTGAYTSEIIYAPSSGRGIMVIGCEFAHGSATSSIYNDNIIPLIIYGNIFNISGTVGSVISLGDGCDGAIICNNTIYENAGGTITTGINISSGALNTTIFGNIIVGCTTSINDAATVTFGGWNCFYNNSSDWTLRDGDIVADPQFMDVANGNFRLKPTSPCLNTGKPTMGDGYTSIGAWQRKSLLR